MYGTSVQSLTLAIWGACRTLEGPGFKPLISKASECDSFEGKGTPEGIFRLDSKNDAESRVTRAGLPLVVGVVARFVQCGAGRAFSGGSLGQTKRRGRWLTDGIVQQSRHARRLPCRSYCCARAWETPWSWGPAVSDSEIYRIQCGRFGLWWRTRLSQ